MTQSTNNVTGGSRDAAGMSCDGESCGGAGGIASSTLTAVVILGLIGVVVVGGIYCVRSYWPARFTRYGRAGYKKTDDTDPLLETPPP